MSVLHYVICVRWCLDSTPVLNETEKCYVVPEVLISVLICSTVSISKNKKVFQSKAGEVSPSEQVWTGPSIVVTWGSPHPLWTNRHDWKHCLPANYVCAGSNQSPIRLTKYQSMDVLNENNLQYRRERFFKWLSWEDVMIFRKNCFQKKCHN